jgi:O-antigen/teichoic acid export membrane protein
MYVVRTSSILCSVFSPIFIMLEKSGYKDIYKTTFLFSFVKVVQILLAIVRNKVLAVLLGAEGVGIIGILSNSASLLQTGAGLGISQSAVRDISEANNNSDKRRFSRIISLTNRVILFTCLLGSLLTIALSPLLSEWTFGDKSYTIVYMWLALVVGLNILAEGQFAILKGMRQMRALAKASVIGSFVGLVTAVPMYYFLGKPGILPSLIIAAVSAAFFSNYFVSKIKYDKTNVSLKGIYREASPMVKMGIALMFVDFLTLLFDLVIASYVRSRGGIEIVGYYRAGTTIIASYFGIVLNGMATDYYPRICAIHNDNVKLQTEVNRQSEVGLTLIFPIAVLFIFLAPFFLRILYSKEFIHAESYTDYAMLGTIIVICSNNMGMILLAKQVAKVYTIYSFMHRLLFLPVYIVFYNLYGLMGLGISYMLNIIVQFVAYGLINNYKYNIKLKWRLNKQLIIVFLTIILTIFIRKIDIIIVKYLLGFSIFLFSCLYSINFLKKVMDINLWEYLKNRIK